MKDFSECLRSGAQELYRSAGSMCFRKRLVGDQGFDDFWLVSVIWWLAPGPEG